MEYSTSEALYAAKTQHAVIQVDAKLSRELKNRTQSLFPDFRSILARVLYNFLTHMVSDAYGINWWYNHKKVHRNK